MYFRLVEAEWNGRLRLLSTLGARLLGSTFPLGSALDLRVLRDMSKHATPVFQALFFISIAFLMRSLRD